MGRAESLHQLDVVVRLCSSGVAERVVDPRAGKVDAQRQCRRGSQHTGKQFVIYNVLLLKVYWKKTERSTGEFCFPNYFEGKYLVLVLET